MHLLPYSIPSNVAKLVQSGNTSDPFRYQRYQRYQSKDASSLATVVSRTAYSVQRIDYSLRPAYSTYIECISVMCCVIYPAI